MKALLFERNVPRFGASRIVSAVAGSGRGVKVGPLRLTDADEPPLPGPQWQRLTVRLAGICGSDLATLDGRSSRYFEDIVSFPFVPGHEIVANEEIGAGVTNGTSEDQRGRRVVVEPVLSCAARDIEPPCAPCASGDTGCCTSLSVGHLSPGLQTGYCADTGGGWGARLVAHSSQIHPVPDSFSDEDAVMVEPAACGVHAALNARIADGNTVAVLGAGTLGLTTLAALRRWTTPKTIVTGAKYPAQRALAVELGADVVAEPDGMLRAVRRATGTLAVAGGTAGTGAKEPRRLAGGADVVIDCVGSADSLSTALAIVRPRGRVVLVGMPGAVKVDLAPLWQREITLAGTYAYGQEDGQDLPGGGQPGTDAPGTGGALRTFDLAFELVESAGLGQLVSASYPLERHEEAVAHAAQAGARGSVKIVFDPRRK